MVIAATMAKPGVVIKRPVGSEGPFGEHAELPKNLGQDGRKAAHKPSARAKEPSAQPDKAAERKAAHFSAGSVTTRGVTAQPATPARTSAARCGGVGSTSSIGPERAANLREHAG